MAKPPKAANPDQFILGHGGYDNLRTAQPYDDNHVFRIDPTPVPVWGIIVYDAFFVAVFFALHWILKYHTGGTAGAWAIYAAPIGIGLMTCTGFTLLAYRAHAKARRLGPWLVYNKASGRVELPRVGMSFEKAEVVHLQYVTTKRLDWGGVANNQRLSGTEGRRIGEPPTS